MYEKGEYWLHYWGLDYKVFDVDAERIAAVNYTIAVCEHVKTGQIETFLPGQIKIIGRSIAK